MLVSRVCALLLLSTLAVPCGAPAQQLSQAQQQQRYDLAIPANVSAGLLASDALSTLRRSDTFRAQCERIAADPRVRVTLALVSSIPAGGRAQTTFRRFRSGLLFAEVEILFGENYRELLAHEFEHVIEQLDGVNLRREAAEGRAWEIAAGTFETRRANRAGQQVLREVAPAHPHVTAAAQPTK
jgi:hypothetical protein